MEASRFSLRTTFLGQTDAPTHAAPQYAVASVAQPQTKRLAVAHAPQPPLHAPHPPQPPPPTQPRAPPTLTFSLISGKPATATAAQSANHPSMTPHAMETMRKLAEAQRMQQQAAPTATVHSAPMHRLAHIPQANNAQRVLESGYIHGGSARTDATAEIMRLTALVDSLNAKLATQAERLSRTEASLVKANRTMTSERATHNGRMLKMQGELKEAKASESKLKEKLASDTSFKTAKVANFEESVRRAEEIDARFEKYENETQRLQAELATASALTQETNAKLSALQTERDALSTQSAEHERLLQEATEARDRAVEESSKVSMAVEGSMAELKLRLDCVEMEKEKLMADHEAAVSTARAAHDALDEQKGALLEQLDALKAEMAAERERATAAGTGIDLSKQTLDGRTGAVEERAAAAVPTSCGDYGGLKAAEAIPEEEDEEEAPMPTGTRRHDDEELRTPPVRFLRTGYKKPSIPTATMLPNTVKSRLTTAIAQSNLASLPIAKAIAPWHADTHTLLSASPLFSTDSFSADAAPEATGETAAEARTKALVAAVSQDITNATLHGRRDYLFALGKTPMEVEKDISALTGQAL